VKSSFLELLLQLTKKRKNVPLSGDQRFELVKILLNKTVKEFDFAIFNCPFDIETKLLKLKWQQIFEGVWNELAAKCPNLLHVTEDAPESTCVNVGVFTFSKLLSLETNCFINACKLVHCIFIKAEILKFPFNLTKVKSLFELTEGNFLIHI